APGGGRRQRRVGRERIARGAPQEVDLLLLRALLVLDALRQLLELLGIAPGAHPLLAPSLVRGLLVSRRPLPEPAPPAAQILLLGALDRELADRKRDRGEQRDDRDGDHQLDKGEAPAHCAIARAAPRQRAPACRPGSGPGCWERTQEPGAAPAAGAAG